MPLLVRSIIGAPNGASRPEHDDSFIIAISVRLPELPAFDSMRLWVWAVAASADVMAITEMANYERLGIPIFKSGCLMGCSRRHCAGNQERPYQKKSPAKAGLEDATG